MRIVTAMMKHETNTFSPIITDWARFQSFAGHEGPGIVPRYQDTRMPIAAYMKLARERGDEIITPLAAEAMPSGPVEEDTFERMVDAILESIQAGCDVALLDLHGAMVAKNTFDGEGELVKRIRAIAPELPIAVTCDLHCNLTADMVDNATAVIGYKTYPHVDMYEVAEQVGQIVLNAVDGKANPTTAWARSKVLSQTLRQGTDDEPMRTLIRMCRDAEARPGVLAATVFGGFALADIPDAGTSAIVITDNDPPLAAEIRDELLATIWETREQFVYEHHPLGEAVASAKTLTDGPIVLLDHADNCGSGATQDVMTVIKEVLEQGLEDVIVACVWDPQAVKEMQKHGPGAEITLSLGGNTDMPSIKLKGEPLVVSGRVKCLTDGRWIVRGPMYTGVEVDMGPSAVLDTGKMQIVIVSHHHEPWDLGVFTSMGIQPEHHRYLLLKSRIHYRAGFAPLAKHTVTLDGDGVTTSDNTLLDYRNVQRPMYPLDRINSP